jgi:hypothetical protein
MSQRVPSTFGACVVHIAAVSAAPPEPQPAAAGEARETPGRATEAAERECVAAWTVQGDRGRTGAARFGAAETRGVG